METSNSFFFFFFPSLKAWKVKYLRRLWSNHQWILLWYLSTSLVKIRNFNPTTGRTSRIFSRWSSTKKVRAKQNFIKDKITGMVNIFWRIFEERKSDKVKIKLQDRKTIVFGNVETLNISAIYKPIILILWIFLWYLLLTYWPLSPSPG